MPVPALHAFVAPVRLHGPALLEGLDDPHAELLALVWGPRFDRQHADSLLSRQGKVAPAVARAVMELANDFDHLGCQQQQRLRQLILRHRGEVTIPYAPYPAD